MSILEAASSAYLIRINAPVRRLATIITLEANAMDRTESRLDEVAAFAAGAMPGSDFALPCSEGEFLTQLGERVRASRMRCDMSRRELARKSGISERYIAQIEAGKGNVSIVLLLRLAFAIRGGQPHAA